MTEMTGDVGAMCPRHDLLECFPCNRTSSRPKKSLNLTHILTPTARPNLRMQRRSVYHKRKMLKKHSNCQGCTVSGVFKPDIGWPRLVAATRRIITKEPDRPYEVPGPSWMATRNTSTPTGTPIHLACRKKTMSDTYVLLQYGADACNIWFQDLEGTTAFTVPGLPCPQPDSKAVARGCLVAASPGAMGPDAAFFYFGPSRSSHSSIYGEGTPTPTPGFIIYGNNRNSIPMGYLQRQNRKGSQSRYFTTQSGRDYKWKIMPQRMELVNSRSTLAVWELSTPTDGFYARLTIRQAGLAIITELMATLTINLMSENFGW
ncbi:hypothetical protein B0H13DRAFT_1874091 [Mycena leptocephala]|nr:hypothetical protein B0H13DRAFT_1874091 [Mycena leptocephala]